MVTYNISYRLHYYSGLGDLDLLKLYRILPTLQVIINYCYNLCYELLLARETKLT